jgi:zinc D-Ala-D-Ala carboxypeptidase
LNLSPHFSLEELTHSELAARRGIDNTPPADVLPRLVNLAHCMELVRDVLGERPIISLSGYRSPAVNRAVGGSSVSAHCKGDAVDFICPSFGAPQEVAKRVRDSRISFDQLIFEGAWVHISFAKTLRGQVLTARFNGGPATYSEGIT